MAHFDPNSKGKGYIRNSMSVNAALAYNNDEMPKSKWTKVAFLAIAEEADDEELAAKIRLLPVAILRERFLSFTAGHHTGAFFNSTGFYRFNAEFLNSHSIEELQALVNKRNEKLAKTKDARKAKAEAAKARTAQKNEVKERVAELAELLPFQTKYKTVNGLWNASPAFIEKVKAARQAAIEAKREHLREVWTKQGYAEGLAEIENDDFIARRLR